MLQRRPAQEFCTDCDRTVYSPTWRSLGFANAHGQWGRFYRTLWICPETGEGYTVRCHHCVLTQSLSASEAELRDAREHHAVRRQAALNAWAASEEQQVELTSQFQDWVADEFARYRRDEDELE